MKIGGVAHVVRLMRPDLAAKIVMLPSPKLPIRIGTLANHGNI